MLIEEIARGGMGVVYRARHQKLGREVAMKVILSGQFASANDVRRFEMEAESAAALDHHGIVPIYEIGQHQGHHFFTMKLIEGGSLAKRIPELRKDLRAFVAIVAQVAEAIDYAHRRGILHRDIKPANILFVLQKIMVIDFCQYCVCLHDYFFLKIIASATGLTILRPFPSSLSPIC